MYFGTKFLLFSGSLIRDPENNKNFVPKYKYPGDAKKDKRQILELLNKYEKAINTNNFIGWPGVGKMGGYAIEGKVMQNGDHHKPGMVISEIDGHPTAKGNEKLAEFIYGQLA